MLPLPIGNDNIPKIFVDSHTKRSELRESYQLQKSRSALILFSAAQALRCGDEAPLPVSGKWVRASARKHAFGSRLRQAKCSACPTQGWVKLAPPDRASTGGSGFSALRGDAKFGGLSCFFFRPHLALSSGPVAAQICGEAPEWGWDSTQPGWGAHSGPQVAQRRGHALCSLPGGTNSTPDFSAFRRARCRAAVCSSTAICWS